MEQGSRICNNDVEYSPHQREGEIEWQLVHHHQGPEACRGAVIHITAIMLLAKTGMKKIYTYKSLASLLSLLFGYIISYSIKLMWSKIYSIYIGHYCTE